MRSRRNCAGPPTRWPRDWPPGPPSAGWDPADLRILAESYVDHTVMTAAGFLEAPPGDAAAHRAVVRAARLRMRIIRLGREHWLD